ncbi:hypothetical protein [Conexibacter sp. CPCC 206217]|uniref:hypothetical protein n=1 Tax=Conexibacter sp. CPCC 206217 TaxID=3064574 RepID=UPI002725A5CE|nr:hypothetical protein [Conexibacter sp. CPCC 206217]MDO8213817.1 hypothetical protein [Conexibacter sp. CPCC 206217]
MDHAMGGVPATAAHEGQPQRPGWWWTIGNLLLAYLLTLAGLLLVVVATSPLHVDMSLAVNRDWPWAPSGVWAIAAGASPALLVAVLFALFLRLMVEWRSDWKLRLAPVVLVTFPLFLLSPPVSSEPQSQQQGFWAFVVLLVVVRQLAIVPQRGAWRPSRPLLVALGTAALLPTLATIAYRPLHPLNVQVGDRQPGGGPHWSFGDGSSFEVPFAISNESFADTRVLSMTPVASGAPVVVQLDNYSGRTFRFEDMYVPFPPAGMPATAEGSLTGRVRLAPGTCRTPGAHRAELRELVLVVETLGLTRTQRIPVSPTESLHCG